MLVSSIAEPHFHWSFHFHNWPGYFQSQPLSERESNWNVKNIMFSICKDNNHNVTPVLANKSIFRCTSYSTCYFYYTLSQIFYESTTMNSIPLTTFLITYHSYHINYLNAFHNIFFLCCHFYFEFGLHPFGCERYVHSGTSTASLTVFIWKIGLC